MPPKLNELPLFKEAVCPLKVILVNTFEEGACQTTIPLIDIDLTSPSGIVILLT